MSELAVVCLLQVGDDISKNILTLKPGGCSTIYTVAFLRMDINSTINSAESTGAKNANMTGLAKIAGP